MRTAVLYVAFVCLCIVHAVHPGCDCVLFSGTYGQSNGQFTSPDFPQPYDPQVGCILYTFTAQRDEIVEITFHTMDLPASTDCTEVDNVALYLHLDRAEVNEDTAVNERLCGGLSSQRVRYYSAFPTLILAFQTFPANNPWNQQRTSFTGDLRFSSQQQSLDQLQRKAQPKYTGFKGTYRFIPKSQFRSDGQRIAGSLCDYQFISSSQGLRKGKFYSPLYPSVYPARSQCFYRFYGRYQERVKIAFEKLVLGDEDTSCLSNPDGLKVYDGGDTRSPVIAHLCGSLSHVELWSSSSSLLIEFFSGSNGSYPGFEAKFYFHPAVTIYELIYDEDDETSEDEDRDNSSEDYNTTTHTTTTTTVPSTTTKTTTERATTKPKTIKTTLKTTTGTLPLRTSGTTTLSPTTTTITTTTIKSTRATTTTVPTISTTVTKISTVSVATTTVSSSLPHNYSSEVNDPQSGLFLDDDNLTSPCDQIIRSDSSKNGTLTSPNYPASYPASMHCNYEFRGHGRERVQIIFTDFHLYHPHDDPAERAAHPWQQQSCLEADRVTAYITVGGKKEKIDDFCGSSTPRELMSNSAVMSMSFSSTPDSKGAKGFQARYAFVSNFGISVGEQLTSMPCAFRFNSTVSANGSFWSPNYPGYYPRDTECHYFFYGRVGERVRIHFPYFDIEGMSPCVALSNSDYVEVSNFMSVDRKLPRYCGQIKDLNLESDGAFFRVTFKSNDRFDATGFYATYQFTPVADAVTITRRRSSSASRASVFDLSGILLAILWSSATLRFGTWK